MSARFKDISDRGKELTKPRAWVPLADYLLGLAQAMEHFRSFATAQRPPKQTPWTIRPIKKLQAAFHIAGMSTEFAPAWSTGDIVSVVSLARLILKRHSAHLRLPRVSG
jgi:hypothetical protein